MDSDLSSTDADFSSMWFHPFVGPKQCGLLLFDDLKSFIWDKCCPLMSVNVMPTHHGAIMHQGLELT